MPGASAIPPTVAIAVATIHASWSAGPQRDVDAGEGCANPRDDPGQLTPRGEHLVGGGRAVLAERCLLAARDTGNSHGCKGADWPGVAAVVEHVEADGQLRRGARDAGCQASEPHVLNVAQVNWGHAIPLG